MGVEQPGRAPQGCSALSSFNGISLKPTAFEVQHGTETVAVSSFLMNSHYIYIIINSIIYIYVNIVILIHIIVLQYVS